MRIVKKIQAEPVVRPISGVIVELTPRDLGIIHALVGHTAIQ